MWHINHFLYIVGGKECRVNSPKDSCSPVPSCYVDPVVHSTLNSAYNEKKYAAILPCYRWLFIKGDVFIGERGIFSAEISFVIGDFLLKVTSL